MSPTSAPLVFGTVLGGDLALLIAVPPAIGVALFISHYAPRRLAWPLGYLVDLLAAIPSVVYGLWGIFFLAPRMVPIYEWLDEHLGFLPFFAGPASVTGAHHPDRGARAGDHDPADRHVDLPRGLPPRRPALNEEAALALGATRWEMIRLTVFPYARSGHRRGRDARPRPRARRDDGGRDRPLGQRRRHLQPDQQRQPLDDRRQHRAHSSPSPPGSRSTC